MRTLISLFLAISLMIVIAWSVLSVSDKNSVLVCVLLFFGGFIMFIKGVLVEMPLPSWLSLVLTVFGYFLLASSVRSIPDQVFMNEYPIYIGGGLAYVFYAMMYTALFFVLGLIAISRTSLPEEQNDN